MTSKHNHHALILSRGIQKIPHLSAFLADYCLHFGQRLPQKVQAACVMGWGYRPTAQSAQRKAAQLNVPYVALEDGFLRSLGLGVQGYPPLSLVLDDLGMYYDNTRPSRLQRYIEQTPTASDIDWTQAEQTMQQIVSQQLSKYNHAPSNVPPRQSSRPVVLVIDQTAGDMSLRYGLVDDANLAQMLQAACTENPHADIWIKTHPDVLSGKKSGCLPLHNLPENATILTDDINPIALLQSVDKVYCATSHMGFEALMCGKPVVCFGLTWYAGWGQTDDRHRKASSLHRPTRTVLQLFAAAYLQYTRYINPNTGERGTIFDVIQHLIQARQHNELLRGDVYCVGVSAWKKAALKPFLNTPSCRLHFVRDFKSLQKTQAALPAKLLVWGNKHADCVAWANERGWLVIRMEDGFIRSVGLGSNLVPPLSLVLDDMGIYFNPQQASRLEWLLQNHEFSPQDQTLAEQVQAALIAQNISKYNVGKPLNWTIQTTQTVLLVVGQVEDDASIRLGAPQICRNADLLRIVRERNPDAYIIYKPHPDVVSGNRIGRVSAQDVARFANQEAAEVDILTCLAVCDEVHTMTSLTGFEALLRGKKVICYGLPFYAGWGLTTDELPIARRSKRLALWQLISGTLLHYPSYAHPKTGQRINALAAIEILQQQKRQANTSSLHRSWISKQIGKAQQLVRTLWR
ncbi:capsular polysaccharide biosynthesis protein [Kingella kingae]|nr:capsular polysaccharide biosynthesis protein [Kingella kingae]